MTATSSARLRAALHDHADEVAPARLTRTLTMRCATTPATGARSDAPDSPGCRSCRGLVVAAGASADRAGDAEQPVAAAGRDGHRHSAPNVAPSAPTPRPSVHHQRGPGRCRASRGPRGAIPWAQVGRAGARRAAATSSQARRRPLDLVSPSGTRYAIGDHPQTGVYDITSDGCRILTGSNGSNAVSESDVAAGTSRSIPPGQQGATYTKPDGKALLTTDLGRYRHAMERRGLDSSSAARSPPRPGWPGWTADGSSRAPRTTCGSLSTATPRGPDRFLPAPSGSVPARWSRRRRTGVR